MRNQTNHGDQNNHADDRQQNQFAEIHATILGQSSQLVKYSRTHQRRFGVRIASDGAPPQRPRRRGMETVPERKGIP